MIEPHIYLVHAFKSYLYYSRDYWHTLVKFDLDIQYTSDELFLKIYKHYCWMLELCIANCLNKLTDLVGLACLASFQNLIYFLSGLFIYFLLLLCAPNQQEIDIL